MKKLIIKYYLNLIKNIFANRAFKCGKIFYERSFVRDTFSAIYVFARLRVINAFFFTVRDSFKKVMFTLFFFAFLSCGYSANNTQYNSGSPTTCETAIKESKASELIIGDSQHDTNKSYKAIKDIIQHNKSNLIQRCLFFILGFLAGFIIVAFPEQVYQILKKRNQGNK